MAPDLEPRATLPWLIRLRWLAAAAQILALSFARWVFDVELPLGPLAAVVAATVASNLALPGILKIRADWPASSVLGGALALDVVLLTMLLAGSGGPMNPFTVLYLVHITLSAVVLSARWVTLVATLSVTGFGLLFLISPADPHAHHRGHGALGHHLEGMWVAFVLAAGLTAFFVRRVVLAIEGQRAQITALREASARNAKLAALTTLAAGAAHELGSPLGTIAVAAHEAELAAEKLPGAESVRGDLRLIQLEADRCREILNHMAARATETQEARDPVTTDDLARRVLAELGTNRARRLTLSVGAGVSPLDVPVEPLTQSVVALIKNAIEASHEDDGVIVRTAQTEDRVSIAVSNRGPALSKAVLDRVGEPFFTTKDPGSGLGLGVFLARAFAESQGGALTIESDEERGTVATLELPVRHRAA